jgi:hypothetical protein
MGVTRFAGILSVAALLSVACGSTSVAATPTADAISGASGCPAAEKQDLRFSGRLAGAVTCSTVAALCARSEANGQGKLGLTAPISAKAASQMVQLLLSLPVDKAGSYPVGPGGYSATTPGEVTFDGIGHWDSLLGGSIDVLTDDSDAATGTVSAQLRTEGDARTLAVSGSWRCLKPASF